MGQTFVIPDIHGRLDLLCDGLDQIAARSVGQAGVIVTLGDYVNKGPDSKGVVDRLLAGVGEGFSLVALKGNHDAMMVDALRDPSNMADWLAKGGDATLASYGGELVNVHAGIDPRLPLDRQSEKTLLWKRYEKGFPGGFGKLHVVHGHDNCPHGPLLYEGRTNLDTLAWRTGRLTIGIFDDDKPGGPTDFIIIKGPSAGR